MVKYVLTFLVINITMHYVAITGNQTSIVEPVQAGDCSRVLPEFGRVGDVQRIFGVRRGILYRWIQDRRVKSVLLRERSGERRLSRRNEVKADRNARSLSSVLRATARQASLARRSAAKSEGGRAETK
jgi:hypothetical protein